MTPSGGQRRSADSVQRSPRSSPTIAAVRTPAARQASKIVGTRGLSSFLLVTPAGGILIDSGERESVPFIPTAQFVIPTAYRSNISGLLISPIAFLWNVDKK